MLLKLQQIFLMQRDRWILWTPVPVGLGIILYFSLHAEPPLYLGMAALGILGLFYRKEKGFHLWLAVVLFALGFTAAQLRTWSIETPMLSYKTYPLLLQGRVTEVDPLPKAYRIVVDQLTIKEGQERQVLPDSVRIRLKAGDSTEPVAGDIVEVKAILQPLSPPVLPGAFDFQRYSFFKGMGATGFAIGNVSIVTPHRGGFFFEHLRQTIRARLEAHIADRDAAAITTALLVGDSNRISEKTWDTIRLAGIAHLIAISGSHITMITGFVFFLARALLAAFPYFALRWPVKKISAFVAILGTVFYMLLIGSPISAVRTVISISTVMLAIMVDRDPFTLRLTACAAFLILLFKPESLMGASFQFSFAAVVALLAFYESTRDWWTRGAEDKNWFRLCGMYLLGCFVTTLIATVATAPFALYNFSRMPLLAGLVANLIAVPVAAFITIPFGFISCILMPMGIEQGPLWITEKSVQVIMTTATTVSQWPHAGFYADAWPLWLLGVIAFGGLWLCLWQGRIRYVGLVPIALAALCIPLVVKPDILVSDNGKLFAVRSDDGKLWVSSGSFEKFVRNEWVQLEGGDGYDIWPVAHTYFLSCDDLACIYKAKGHVVSFIKRPEALAEDCKTADLVISAEKLAKRLCNGKTIIHDKWDIRREGAHAIYLSEDGTMDIDTVLGARGNRPWTGKGKAY